MPYEQLQQLRTLCNSRTKLLLQLIRAFLFAGVGSPVGVKRWCNTAAAPAGTSCTNFCIGTIGTRCYVHCTAAVAAYLSSFSPPFSRTPPSPRQVRLKSGSSWDAAHPSCDSPNTSGRFALGASNVCMVGENPRVLRPGIAGMRWSMVIRSRPCMIMSTPLPADQGTGVLGSLVCVREGGTTASSCIRLRVRLITI